MKKLIFIILLIVNLISLLYSDDAVFNIRGYQIHFISNSIFTNSDNTFGGILSKEEKIGSFYFKSGREIIFYPEGIVKTGSFSKWTVIYDKNMKKNLLKPGDIVELSHNGFLLKRQETGLSRYRQAFIILFTISLLVFSIDLIIRLITKGLGLFDLPGQLFTGLTVNLYGRKIYYRRYRLIDEKGGLRFGMILSKPEEFNLNDNKFIFKRISLYDSGEIRSGILVFITNVNAGGIPFELTSGETVYFHKNGFISRIFLISKKIILINGLEFQFKNNSVINFYLNGFLMNGILDNDTYVNLGNKNLIFKSDSIIEFYDNGNIKKGFLRKDIEWICGKNRIIIDSHFEVCFYREGFLKYCRSKEKDTEILINDRKIYFKGGEIIGFDNNSSVRTHDYTLEFYENGEIARGILSVDTEFIVDNKPVFFISGDKQPITFYSNNTVKSGFLSAGNEIRYKQD